MDMTLKEIWVDNFDYVPYDFTGLVWCDTTCGRSELRYYILGNQVKEDSYARFKEILKNEEID